MLATGFVVERIYVYALRRYRQRLLQVPATRYSTRAFQVGMALMLDIGQLLVFGIAAIVFFFAWWLDHDLRRLLELQILFVVFVVRVVALLTRFLLDRGSEHERLLPFDDQAARRLRGFIIALAVLFGVSIAMRSLLDAAGSAQDAIDVIAVGFWVVGFVILVSAVWSVRKPIADLIRGDGHRGAVVGWLADLWPIAATGYFAALLFGGLFNVLAGTPLTTGTGFASVLLMAGQNHITTIQLGALIYFAFPISMAMLAMGISDVYGLILFAIIYGVANGLVTILRGMAVPEFIGPEGYGVVSGALTMPTNVMRAAGPLLGAFAWSAFGNYTPVLWGLAAIMLVAAAGFAAAAIISKRQSLYPPV